MTFITNDITTTEGVAKKQFYSSLGMQDFTTGDIVQVRQWAGEYSKEELEEQKAQIESQLSEVNEKLGFFIE